jgi:hypothetical protein
MATGKFGTIPPESLAQWPPDYPVRITLASMIPKIIELIVSVWQKIIVYSEIVRMNLTN